MRTIANIRRAQITVTGVVQGVGFRPFVYNLSLNHGLVGFVRNNHGVVEIEVQGPGDSIDSFTKSLKESAPRLSLIENIAVRDIGLNPDTGELMQILSSTSSDRTRSSFVPADSATCADCLNELIDATNRRFRYPFINCTNCGPRFTIISSLPYDRASTTMARFRMCKQCQSEYDDPRDRRFHAQPNACAECGPRLTLTDGSAPTLYSGNDDALAQATEHLRGGSIIAAKGLGGFHLICDATNSKTLNQLRGRKRRSRKPLALLMRDMSMVRKYCHCSEEEELELTGGRRPIVLLKRRPDCTLPEAIAPGIDRLGVMLPYTPLHHLLMNDIQTPLIATSANLSEEPIAIDNEEAIHRLRGIADFFLLHDRSIYSRYDDSIVQIVDTKPAVLRRARGFAPLPIKLPFRAQSNVLACGAHLKNTFCIIRDDQAFVSQHIGDLENAESLQHFEETIDIYSNLFGFTAQIVANDCHPDYLSTTFAKQYAEQHRLPRFDVQHHHAHIVSCMVEHGLTTPAIGVAFDGLGLGTDDTLWGGEFMITALDKFERFAYLESIGMPGGTQAIKQPWRMALSYLKSGTEDLLQKYLRQVTASIDQATIALVQQQLERHLNTPLTSSCGRLFDAVSAVLNICLKADYEGQAAIELQTLAERETLIDSQCLDVYPFEIFNDQPPYIVRAYSIVEAVYAEYLMNTKPSTIAAKFHRTIAQLILSLCLKARQSTGNNIVCLAGGVFQNALLTHLACELLSNAQFKVLYSRNLPSNDGGLSLGQAVVALAQASAIVYDHSNGGAN